MGITAMVAALVEVFYYSIIAVVTGILFILAGWALKNFWG